MTAVNKFYFIKETKEFKERAIWSSIRKCLRVTQLTLIFWLIQMLFSPDQALSQSLLELSSFWRDAALEQFIIH